MLISGWVKTSLLDYPGRISSVVFTQGCNLNCFYCHNKKLIDMEAKDTVIEENQIFDFLKMRKNVIDGVVVTGGEPTIQKDLDAFLQKIKKMDLLVKLDTNGTEPEVLKRLISAGLVDYFAMDIKVSFERKDFVYGKDISTDLLEESVNIIRGSGIEHEFRTTVAPGIMAEDIERIRKMIGKNTKYAVQKCSIPNPELDIEEVAPRFSGIERRGF